MNGLAESKAPGYSRTQQAPLCLILYGSALACITLAWTIGDRIGTYTAGGVSLLFTLLAPAFHHLTSWARADNMRIEWIVSLGHASPKITRRADSQGGANADRAFRPAVS